MKKLVVLSLVLVSVGFMAWSCGSGTPTSSGSGGSNPTATFTSVLLTSTPTGPTSTPTNTPTATPTSTITNTPTNTGTNTVTNTRTNSPTNTTTNTPGSATNTPTNTPTNTSTNTGTNTATNSPTATVTGTATTSASWQVVGSAAFGVPSVYDHLIFNSGNPYVVYADTNNGSKGMVEEYSGTTWAPTSYGMDFTPGAAGYICPAFYNNNLYVSYSDGTEAGLVTVEEYTGTAWVTIGSPGFGAGAGDTTLAIDGSGHIYVAFEGVNNSYLMEYTGAGATGWVTVGGIAYSTGGGIFNSVAFDSSNNPYVAFGDSYYGGGTLVEYASSAWATLGGTSAAGGGASSHVSNYTSLVFNGSNSYVAYMDTNNNDLPNLREWNGAGWSNVGTEGFGTTAKAYYTSLAFSPTNGNPYVSFSDENNTISEAMVMEYTGAGTTGWVTVGSGHFSAYSTSYNSLAFDASGNPYVAYADGNSSNKVTVMEYH